MTIIDNFANVKVLVVGDVMLDRYWWGSVNRISPEAPVPVVRLDRKSYAPGGAANVAANIAGLGATPYLIGVIGNDEEAELFPNVLDQVKVSGEHLIRLTNRQTTIKTRVVAHGQQIARIDQETDNHLDQEDENVVLGKILELMDSVDVVIVSDYAKGLLTDKVLAVLIETARNRSRIVLVDPKGKDYRKYSGATVLTPNKREAADACGFENHSEEVVAKAGDKLMCDLNLGALLITQGEDGMTLFQPERKPYYLNSFAREVYDVTGAGDTVIATLGVAVGAGANLEEASNFANIAAGVVVGQIGTTAIDKTGLEHAIDK